MGSATSLREVTHRQEDLARWLALAGLVGPIAFVLVFTLAGAIRPGYSPIHQAVSDLGVGSNALLLNGAGIVNALLMAAFVVGFHLRMQNVIGASLRWLCSALLMLAPIGLATSAIFTEAPATLAIHWHVGANLLFAGPLLAFLVVGFALRRNSAWRAWGNYSLVACALTLAINVAMTVVWTPGSPIAPLHLGGLAERVLLIEVLAWYGLFGWRLFRMETGPTGRGVITSSASTTLGSP